MSVLMATQHWAKTARCECHRRSRFVCHSGHSDDTPPGERRHRDNDARTGLW
jgi:hypothetical protein